jgi:hypothetical protein
MPMNRWWNVFWKPYGGLDKSSAKALFRNHIACRRDAEIGIALVRYMLQGMAQECISFTTSTKYARMSASETTCGRGRNGRVRGGDARAR